MINKAASLTPEVLHIIQDKGTEPPFAYSDEAHDEAGTYLCRQCGLALFHTQAKFHSGCGWPSFDNAIQDNVKTVPDSDGRRTEILCRRCDAHLGHVFSGEGFTPTNTRHCVNTLSLDFVSDPNVEDTEEAIFAAGCFWGVQKRFNQVPGVVKTEVGYTGGQIDYPSYEMVCSDKTGHVEAIRVVFDPQKTNYEKLLEAFFQLHNPTQPDGQGPDRGSQYLSKLFCYNEAQRQLAQKAIARLKQSNLPVVTIISDVSIFWPAESGHQNYYR